MNTPCAPSSGTRIRSRRSSSCRSSRTSGRPTTAASNPSANVLPMTAAVCTVPRAVPGSRSRPTVIRLWIVSGIATSSAFPVIRHPPFARSTKPPSISARATSWRKRGLPSVLPRIRWRSSSDIPGTGRKASISWSLCPAESGSRSSTIVCSESSASAHSRNPHETVSRSGRNEIRTTIGASTTSSIVARTRSSEAWSHQCRSSKTIRRRPPCATVDPTTSSVASRWNSSPSRGGSSGSSTPRSARATRSLRASHPSRAIASISAEIFVRTVSASSVSSTPARSRISRRYCA